MDKKTNSLFFTLPVGDDVPNLLNIIVENPTGNINKFEYNKKTGVIVLDRVLFETISYPFDYGFIPQTWYDDNDPLDIMCLVSYPTFPGVVVKARPIALLKMVDTGEQDDKVLAVSAQDPRFDHIKSIKDISPHTIKEIEFFFKYYKTLENKKVEINGWGDLEETKRIIEKGIKMYKEKFKS